MKTYELFLQLNFDETYEKGKEFTEKFIEKKLNDYFKNVKILSKEIDEKTNLCEYYFSFESKNLYDAKISLLSLRLNSYNVEEENSKNNLEKLFYDYEIDDDFENYED